MGSADRVLEENGEVVDHGVAARKLLHHLRAGTEKQTTAMLGLATSEEYLHGSAVAIAATDPDGISNDVDLKRDLIVLNRLVRERCEDNPGFLCSVLCQEPSGRLGQSKGENQNDA